MTQHYDDIDEYLTQHPEEIWRYVTHDEPEPEPEPVPWPVQACGLLAALLKRALARFGRPDASGGVGS